MVQDQSALLELLEAMKVADADDVVRQAVESVFQALIDAEARIGAAPHERTEARVTPAQRVSGSAGVPPTQHPRRPKSWRPQH